VRLSCTNSFEIFEGYHLILDCTDTPAARYLINDTAVLLGIPLVSASALKTEGQLSVLNFKSGPCYRCLFPVAPPPDSVLACGDGGILGPVVGVMGLMQAIEAIKILTGAYDEAFTPSLTMFSAYSAPQWRYIRMRDKKKDCAACGVSPAITREAIEASQYSYVEFCGRATQVHLKPMERISVEVCHLLYVIKRVV
jgi:adenylyltransferase/sulfurtransferase